MRSVCQWWKQIANGKIIIIIKVLMSTSFHWFVHVHFPYSIQEQMGFLDKNKLANHPSQVKIINKKKLFTN